MQKDMHLIAIDSMDNKQQGRFSASGLMKALLDRVKISIPDSRIHARYYALTHNGRSVNCNRMVLVGPWSTEILSRLTPDRCKAIVSDSRALDKLILMLRDLQTLLHGRLKIAACVVRNIVIVNINTFVTFRIVCSLNLTKLLILN